MLRLEMFLSVVLLLCVGIVVNANLIVNGGFEEVDEPRIRALHWNHYTLTGAYVARNTPGTKGTWAQILGFFHAGIEQKTIRPLYHHTTYHLSFLYGVPYVGVPWEGQFGCNLTVSLGGAQEKLAYKEGLDTKEFNMYLTPTEFDGDGKATLQFDSDCDGYQASVLDEVVLVEAA